MREKSGRTAYRVVVKGLVQGVGFRPFVYQLARKHLLEGWVRNTNESVRIHIQGEDHAIKAFLYDLESAPPVAASIDSVTLEESVAGPMHDFIIARSKGESEQVTRVSPDIAVCAECLPDMQTQPHRENYPFINCTHCGPRFTIIEDLPYDRENTTMRKFKMCPVCRSEYEDIEDRRFHAQPVACNVCGPVYRLYEEGMQTENFDKILARVSRLLGNGGILAVKGLGGFHLACDALNEEAVARLRDGKIREEKPFAVMFRDIESLTKFARVNDVESEILSSWRRPIVILPGNNKPLAPSVSVGFGTIGAMLPYMPFHYALFSHLDLPALVLTSGNLSDDPIVTDNETARRVLLPISDALLEYNRDISNRTDDSVGLVARGKMRLIRRSRGYVPSPVTLPYRVEGILGTGAELVNCFCIGKDHQAIMSQHIGDLKNYETYAFYRETIAKFKRLFRFESSLIAHDMHPDYLSTTYALESDVPRTAVQHHHAHIASCMAENGIDEKVIGVAMDGTGYGSDGKIWGGEFMECDLRDFERTAHFRYIPLPGGDKVIHEPWRSGLAYLYSVFGEKVMEMDLPFLKKIPSARVRMVMESMQKKINCPESSAAGRLFDAVSAILNVCTTSGFHAEAPMRMESVAGRGHTGSYPFRREGREIIFDETLSSILEDTRRKTSIPVISARFHNTIINVIFAVTREIRERTGLCKVLLSGGVFQNRCLLEGVEDQLENDGFRVYSQHEFPVNDGGIALGQLAIAAKRRK